MIGQAMHTKAPSTKEGAGRAKRGLGEFSFFSPPDCLRQSVPPLRRGGSCRGSRGGRPMVAPTFTAGTAIKFVGADILARQSLRRLRRHLPLHKGGYPLRRGRADEYPQGAGRICNAPSSRTAALGIGPYNHDRKCGTRSKKRADRVVRPDKRCGVNRKSGQGRPPLQEVRRKPEERAGRLSLQHKNAAIQHGWLRFDLGCYSPFSLSKKLLRLGCEASPVASSSLRSSSFCSLVSFVGVSTTTVTNRSPRVL